MFADLCATASASDADGMETWSVMDGAAATLRYGGSISQVGLTNFLDPDLFYDAQGVVLTNGSATGGDTCTLVGRGARPDAFCATKCDGSDMSNYAYLVLGQDSPSAGLFGGDAVSAVKALVVDVCATFCAPIEDTCRYQGTSLPCKQSATNDATCLRTCDLTTASATLRSPTSCVPMATLVCNASDPSSTDATFTRSCSCPLSTDADGSGYCSCSYNFGVVASQAAPAPNVLPFICPRTIRDPTYHFFSNMDYDALTEAVRFTLPREFSSAPLLVKSIADISELPAAQYDVPKVTNTRCQTQFDYSPMTLDEDEPNLALAMKLGMGQDRLVSSHSGWVYKGNNVWISAFQPLENGTMPVSQYACPGTQILGNQTAAVAKVEVVGKTVCASWKVTEFSEVCPPEWDTGAEGVCRTEGGYCAPDATLHNPYPSETCDPDAFCGSGVLQPTNCHSADKLDMVASACAEVTKAIEYPQTTYNTMATTTMGYPVWMYIRDSSSNTSPDLNDDDLSRYEAYPACYSEVMSCDNSASESPSDLGLRTGLAGAFIEAFGSDLINGTLSRTQASFSALGGEVPHVATMSETRDFCDMLCPNDDGEDTDCMSLLPLDCDSVRSKYATMSVPITGTAAARYWLCAALSPEVHVLDETAFPLAGRLDPAVPVAGAGLSITSPLGTSSCPGSDGSYQNSVVGKQTSPCFMQAPSRSTALTDTQCEAVQRFAADLTGTYDSAIYRKYGYVSTATARSLGEQQAPKSSSYQTCSLKSCDLPQAIPHACHRINPPLPRVSIPLPKRICNMQPILPCVRCLPYKWIPENATTEYLVLFADLLSAGAPVVLDNLARRALAADRPAWMTHFDPIAQCFQNWTGQWRDTSGDPDDVVRDELVRELYGAFDNVATRLQGAADAVKRQHNDRRQSAPVEIPGLLFNVYMHIGRAMDHAVCQRLPHSPQCTRLALARQKGETSADLQTRAYGGSFDQVLPRLEDMPRDCFLLCGYNYTLLMERACLWYATDRSGSIGAIWDAIMSLRSVICDAISPGKDGTEHYEDGGGLLSVFNLSSIDLSLAKIKDEDVFLGDLELIKRIKSLVATTVYKTTGVRPANATVEEIAAALMARLMNKKNATAAREEVINFFFNFNMDHPLGDVGLIYYASVPVPLPIGVDCYKAEGELRLFGIPIWNPLWAVMPTWVPPVIARVTDWLANLRMIAPASLVKYDGGCSDTDTLGVPFTKECECSAPSFRNCGEVHGFADPLDSAAFLLHWFFPDFAKSKWVTVPATVLLLNKKLHKFDDVTRHADFDAYLYCFWLTAPGAIGLIFVVDIIIAMLVWWAAMIIDGLVFIGTITIAACIAVVGWGRV